MEELRVVPRGAGARTCLYCRDPVETPTRCDRCDATYHPECRAELGRCATPGCESAVRRSPPPPQAPSAEERAAGAAAAAAAAAERASLAEARARVAADLDERRRADALGSRTAPAVLWVGGLGAFAALLAVTVHAFVRPGAAADAARLWTPVGVLLGPPAMVGALRAMGSREPARSRAGWATFLLLCGAALLAPVVDVWWHIPTFVGGAAQLAGLATAARLVRPSSAAGGR